MTRLVIRVATSCVSMTSSALAARSSARDRFGLAVCSRPAAAVEQRAAGQVEPAEVAVRDDARRAGPRRPRPSSCPGAWRVISSMTSLQRRVLGHDRDGVPRVHQVARRGRAHASRARRAGGAPRSPPGAGPRSSSSAMASASPMASAAVVLEVGARFIGHASSATLTSSDDVALAGRAWTPGLPVSSTMGTPSRLSGGQDRQHLVGLARSSTAPARRRRAPPCRGRRARLRRDAGSTRASRCDASVAAILRPDRAPTCPCR